MIKKYLFNKFFYNKNKFFQHPSNFVIYKNDDISKEIILYGLYERDILFALSKKIFPKLDLRKNLIDIGANIGNHSIFFSEFFNKIYSFEPINSNFEILKINSYKKNNINIFNYGCSDKQKTVYLEMNLKNNFGNYSIIAKKSNQSEKVKLKKLDDLILKNKIKNIGVVKIDVEGHELEVFKGGIKVLKHMSPILLFESNFQENNFEILKFLKDNNYKYFYEFRFLSISHNIFLSHFKKLKIRIIILFFLKIFFTKKYYDLIKIRSFKKRKYPMIIGSKDPILA